MVSTYWCNTVIAGFCARNPPISVVIVHREGVDSKRHPWATPLTCKADVCLFNGHDLPPTANFYGDNVVEFTAKSAQTAPRAEIAALGRISTWCQFTSNDPRPIPAGGRDSVIDR